MSIKTIITETPEAFRNGIISASSAGRKIRRWTALVALWLSALACITLAVIASVQGYPIQGAIIGINAFTFTVLSGSVIYNASADEYWRQSVRSMDAYYGQYVRTLRNIGSSSTGK